MLQCVIIVYVTWCCVYAKAGLHLTLEGAKTASLANGRVSFTVISKLEMVKMRVGEGCADEFIPGQFVGI